jgi:hypothetical protein
MKLFAYRLWKWVEIYFHRFWWVTYPAILLLILEFVRWRVGWSQLDVSFFKFLLEDFSYFGGTDFEKTAVVISGLVAFAVSIRQHKDSKAQSLAAYSPSLFRTSFDSPIFNWNSGLLVINNTADLDAEGPITCTYSGY